MDERLDDETSESEDEKCLDILSSSSSSSSSDEENVVKKVRIENFVETIEEYTNKQFRQHFRISRIVAQRLIDGYITHSRRDNHGGRPETSKECEVYLTLWYLANTETYRQISDRFNVTKSSVYRILRRVIKWIVEHSARYIRWPSAPEAAINKIIFQRKNKIPNVVGAIDSCHIQINAPRKNKEAYYNRKRYYSILLQGVVDVEKKFIDVYCGEPGAMHDARLFRKSTIYSKLEEDHDLMVHGGYLLGDTAYSSSNYLIAPYTDFGNLTQKQKKFNYLHSATRIVVKDAFSLLKSRFRRLKFFENPDLGFIANCVVAACVLHNICIFENDIEKLLESDSTSDEPDDPDELPNSEGRNVGKRREELFSFLDGQNLLN